MPRIGDTWTVKPKSRDSFLPPVTSTPLMERQKRPALISPNPEQSEQASKQRRTVSPVASISSGVNGSARNSEDRRSEESAVAERPESTTPSEGSVVYKKAAGWIKKVEMKDFLIHSDFAVEFGSSVNFVTGSNGSGKSSIASAIAIALGGRCTLTDRKGKLSDFVKHGRKTAFIRVTLSNEGRNAYLPGIWGKSIVVERRIQKEGKNSRDAYRIVDENGALIGDTQTMLKRIVHRMNIQIDNPVFFLNQRMSKEFMQLATPKVMYKFFYQASGFDTVETANQGSGKSVGETDKEIARLEREAVAVEKELEEKKSKRDVAIDEKDLYEKLEGARRNRLYYEHKQFRDELSDLETAVANIKDRLDDIDGELEAKQNTTQDDEVVQHTLRQSEEMEKYRKLAEKKGKALEAAKEKLKEHTKALTSLKRKAKALSPGGKTPKARSRISTTSGQRASPLASGEQSAAEWAQSFNIPNRSFDNSIVNRTSSRRNELERSILQSDERENDLDGRLETLEKRYKELIEYLDKAGNVDEEYRRKEKEIEQLKKDGVRTWKGSVSVETRNVATALSKLDDDDKGCVVLGLLADEVALRDDTFGIAADHALSPWLETFFLLVPAGSSTTENFGVLSGIKYFCSSEGCTPPAFLLLPDDALSAEAFRINRDDVRKIAPNAKFMQDIVKVGKNNEMKILMKNVLPARNFVFVEESALAQRLSISGIPGLEKVYDAAGFCYGFENGTWNITAPEVRTLTPQTVTSYTQIITAAESEKIELAGQKQLREHRTEELFKVKQQLTELKDRMMRTVQHGVSARKELKVAQPNFEEPLQTQRSAWDPSLSETLPSTSHASLARSSLAPSVVDNNEDEGMGEEPEEEDLAEEEQQPEEGNDELTRLNESIHKGTETAKQMRANIKKLEKEHKEAVKNYNTLQQASAPASMRTRGAEKEKKEAIVRLKAEKDTLNKQLKEKNKLIAACEENKKNVEEELAELDVEDPDEMPEPTQSFEDVLKELEIWNKAQEHLLMNKDAISRKQLNEQIETLEQRKKDGTRDLENAKKLQTYMDENWKQRVLNKEVGLARAADQAQKHCITLMEEQGFKCQLSVNIPAGTVDYRVAPRSNTVLGPLNVLSGGERSMALAALLTSFWDQRSPFRVLDEFEVCMDNKNREAAMKFLVQRATYDSAQCIFFSPLNIDLDRIAQPGVIHRVELESPPREQEEEEPGSDSEN
ncbi:hypothetical protein RvY_00417 [Ramazzottius varieornatus]|uniref:RecF/RecN/SMC N-terminal domain-containing protein n=1 Tax=Ramazzottius varieornatus TaxID=947166 RepID=A0A1D1UJ02_RAMVA|nr:hypothetical protein RvY_00417 [Ramazzottius varieornatus]